MIDNTSAMMATINAILDSILTPPWYNRYTQTRNVLSLAVHLFTSDEHGDNIDD